MSYAKEDIEPAVWLYDQLLSENYSPWLDKKRLSLGSNWDYEIKKALKESTFIILLLSSNSVAKRGYVQREYRLALEYAETKLEDDIYIIRVLLDKCTVPFNIDKFQWIEYAGENAIEQIVKALNFQRAKYLASVSKDKINIEDYINLSYDLKVKSKTKADFSCKVPQYINNPFFDESFINSFIQHTALLAISVH
ncbi:MAG: toll/interleukin-1 receptor domain-containing protein [Chitinophagaceae bacterium]